MAFGATQVKISLATSASDPVKLRRQTLERVDRELSKGNFSSALSLVKRLKRKHGGLFAFGSPKQVPYNLSTKDKSYLYGADISSLQPVVDSVMNSIQNCNVESDEQVSANSIMNISDDIDGRFSYKNARFLMVQHEAGHFLVGYLLGHLPKLYEVPSVEALMRDITAAAKVKFMGFEFLKEVDMAKNLKNKTLNNEGYHKANRDNISSKALNNFTCVALGGLVSEHMLFGGSAGLHSDIDKVNSVLDWLGYTESETEAHMRWATFNTVFLLHQHKEARSRLADAMALGKSVGSCINILETAIYEQRF